MLRSRAMSVARRLAASSVLLLLALAASGRSSCRADDPSPTPRLPLAEVRPGGGEDAEARLGHARALLDAGQRDEALDLLVGEIERVPSPLVRGEEPGAHVPAALVAERRVAALPPELVARAVQRLAPAAAFLVRQALRGDEAALDRLCARFALAPDGSAALLARAARDLERGRPARARAAYERWLALHPEGPADVSPERQARRAAVRRGLAVARDALLQPRVATASAPPGGRAGPGEGDDAPERAPHAAGAARAEDAVVLWSRRLGDAPAAPSDDRRETGAVVRAGAAADDGRLLVDDGRSVAAYEAETGRLLWRFPTEPEAQGPDGDERYAPYDRPCYDVRVAGHLALAVLGAPGGEGAFRLDGRLASLDDLPRESRVRLVALEAATGALVWATGRADASDSFLADPDTGVASPPLVRGDRVYVLVARRRGAAEIALACLDLETGRARFVAPLASGESGRQPRVAEGDERFERAYVDAVPWGARPAEAEGEVLALPHAGFAAGVVAETGEVRWVRALPRYPGSLPAAEAGFSARNEPLFAAGAWWLAPMDAPRLVAIQAWTGAVETTLPRDDAPGTPPWRHLLGPFVTPSGEVVLDLVGDRPTRLVPGVATATLDDRALPASDAETRATGRPLDDGAALVRSEGGLVRLPWSGPVLRVSLGPGAPDLPEDGDVLRAGRLHVVVGADRVAVLGARSDAVAWARARLDDARALDPAARAAAAALLARVGGDEHDVLEALSAAVVRESSCPRATDGGVPDDPDLPLDLDLLDARPVSRTDEALARLDLLLALPAPGAATRIAALVERLATSLADEPRLAGPLARRLGRWVVTGADQRVEVGSGSSLRADLYAASRLRWLATRPEARAEMERLGAEAERRVASAAEGPLPALVEAVRSAVGTPAASAGRRRLVARLLATHDEGLAAAALADLRLGAARTASLVELAALERQEARLLLGAGEERRAARLAGDLAAWSPDDPDTRAVLEDADVAAGARAHPLLDLWSSVGPPEGAGDLAALVVPQPVGPGRDRVTDRLVVFRGLDAEVWDLRRGVRTAEVPGGGAGWFGGALHAVAPWLPEGGVIVTSVVAREPADVEGFRAGDWIVSWDGRRIGATADFMADAARARPGESVEVVSYRAGRRRVGRFTPGRRPLGQSNVVDRDDVWMRADGRALVPTRDGLLLLDVGRGEATRLWSWDEAGVVDGVRVLFGLAVVTVRGRGTGDLLVAVDPESGRERWRRALPGTLTRLAASGSAVVASVESPARVLLVDAFDGRERFRVDVLERRTDDRQRTILDAPVSAEVAGRLFAIAPSGDRLLVIDTSTGEGVWEKALAGGVADPLIAAGSFVVLGLADRRLEVVAPDPRTGAPMAERTWMVPTPPSEDPVHAGPFLTDDARLFVAGHAAIAVGGGRGQELSVAILEVRVDARGMALRAVPVPAPYLFRALGPWPFLTASRTRQGGVVIVGTTGGDGASRETAWIGADGSIETWRDPLRPGGVIQPRRSPPAFVGDRLLLPTDEGVSAVPLVRPRPR